MGKFLEEISVKNHSNMVVGKNGSGDFDCIQDALNYCSKVNSPVTLRILSGEYKENITLYQSNIKILGVGTVKIIGNKFARELDRNGQEIGTFQTATLFINAENVMMENIEIINNAGPGEKVGQAMALYNEGDNITFRNCSFRGFQDTLCLGPLPPLQKDGTLFSTPKIDKEVARNRTFFEGCYIEGTVDFIFGGGESLFKHCEVRSLLRQENKEGYITAASTSKDKKGFHFSHCYLTAELGVENVYLGRPWRPFANVLFTECRVGAHIVPSRWDDWGKKENRKTVRYIEEGNIYLTNRQLETIDWILFK